eukprot:gb/GECG01008002.1/.p1 GENE.gb/GECG01008002.1/~~gb/GECG01008002.1/.p1  ORF type:complete len:185 (+),score=53.29 gb/GECG01008002.1/:1-555(+)
MAEVVEFIDPAEKRAQERERRRKEEQQRKAKAEADRKKWTPKTTTKKAVKKDKKGKEYDPEKAEERREFNKIFDEVVEFGATAFDRKNKKQWEAKKLKNAGLKVEHKEKMPYRMWLGVKRERERKETKKEEEVKESKVVTGKNPGKTQKKDRSKPFKADPSKSLETGRYKDGVLRVNPNMVPKS